MWVENSVLMIQLQKKIPLEHLEEMSNWAVGATGRQSKLSPHRHIEGESSRAAAALCRIYIWAGDFSKVHNF